MALYRDIETLLDCVGRAVKLHGFAESCRRLKTKTFVIVRHDDKRVQCLINTDKFDLSGIVEESFVEVCGLVSLRSEKQITSGKLGHIEIVVDSIRAIGKREMELPFQIFNSSDNNLEIRERYRFLDLRNSLSRGYIVERHKLLQFTREYFFPLGFIEIATPILTGQTPEGASNYLVSSRRFKDQYYALPQSPQLFKQLLMCSGFSKYIQISPCFRDEECRENRISTEFTQIDIEAAGEDMQQFIDLIKDFIVAAIQFLKPEYKVSVSQAKYDDLIEEYGFDYIDHRAIKKFCLKKIDDSAYSIECAEEIYKRLCVGYPGVINKVEGKNIMNSKHSQFKPAILELSKIYDELYFEEEKEFCMVIVTHFPYYELDDNGDMTYGHNPFSKTYDNEGKIYAYQYDFILNGNEICGGSRRETCPVNLKRLLPAGFENFIEAYSYGAPEHMGCAVGLERFLYVINNKSKIYDFTAFFPRKSGYFTLVPAPV